MAWLKQMLDTPGVVAGGIAGLVASVLVALAPALVSAVANYTSFNRNIAMEAIKNAKTPADVKAVLDLLCARKFITDKDQCL